MAFQTPITIKEAVDNIHAKQYVLPAIQRELVWKPHKIEVLWDSLMRDYPIGSFLFWHVNRSRPGDAGSPAELERKHFQFYEFVSDYHERDGGYSPQADIEGEHDITAVLDGQQRLCSLYIGLTGSYSYKEPRKRRDNNAAFPKRKLYLNLFSKSAAEDIGKEYDFRFMTEEEAKIRDIDKYWFRVGEILDIKDISEVNDYLNDNDVRNYGNEAFKFANKTLFKMYSLVYQKPVINYYLEKDESLDRVLNIFNRVNSAGTVLSHSDLLLSLASAQWKEKDAREEITAFVGEIKRVGDGFEFDKDFVLKACLVLCDVPDIAFKVDNFNKANMLTVEQNWGKISSALRLTVSLIASYGYNRDTLTSRDALIPIAYYLLKKGSPEDFVEGSRYMFERYTIQKWLIASLLKRVFSEQPDDVLRPIRQIIGTNSDTFPFDEIVKEFKGRPKSLSFNNDEIQSLFFDRYGSAYIFSTLALLYPTLDFRNKFHQDHIFPKSFFTRTSLERRGVSLRGIEFGMENFNSLANLQLLEGKPNPEKSNLDFDEWLSKTYPKKQARADYMEKHYIPDVDLNLKNFEKFITERKKLIASRFSSLLQF